MGQGGSCGYRPTSRRGKIQHFSLLLVALEESNQFSLSYVLCIRAMMSHISLAGNFFFFFQVSLEVDEDNFSQCIFSWVK